MKLARDAFLNLPPYAQYGSSTGTYFQSIVVADVMTTGKLDDVNLGMKIRGVPFAQTYDGSPGSIICLASPGQIRDLKNEASVGSNLQNTWIDTHAYARDLSLVNGEVGSYRGVRFVESNDCILWNCGRITAQASIKASVAAGDGAPDPGTTQVDGTYNVGQAAATHSILVDSTTGFTLYDRVSIHVTRGNHFGVTNGADFRDGKFMTRQIVSIPDATHLVFDEPIMEGFTTDLGGAVYGYVTLGTNIHAAVFIGAADGVAMGVLQSPEAYVLDPVDDARSQYRAVWKARLGYNLYRPKAFEVVFTAGSVREKGSRVIR